MKTLAAALLLLLATACPSTYPNWPPPEMRRCKETVIDPDGTVHHFDPLYNCTEFHPAVPYPKQTVKREAK